MNKEEIPLFMEKLFLPKDFIKIPLKNEKKDFKGIDLRKLKSKKITFKEKQNIKDALDILNKLNKLNIREKEYKKILKKAVPGKPSIIDEEGNIIEKAIPGQPSHYVSAPIDYEKINKELKENLQSLKENISKIPISVDPSELLEKYLLESFEMPFYGKGLTTGGDIVSSIASLMNKAGIDIPELHLPGHNFTGPFTKLEERLDSNDKPYEWSKPINKIDEISMKHDLCYRDRPLSERGQCDREMLEALDNIKDPTLRERAERKLVKTIIAAKERFGMGEIPQVQSILFNKKKYPTIEKASSWIKKNNFKNEKIDETENYYRFRQKDPKIFNKFYTIGDKNIKFIIAY